MEEIRPQEGPQTEFLTTPADIAIYGGAAGGGKTFAMLIEPLRHIGVPGFGAVIFRRTSEMIRAEGGLWDNSTELYPQIGGKGRELNLDWRFPSGASVTFDSLQHEKNVLDFQGAQICLLGFDELTHFTERQFWYLVSRNRSTCGIRPYVRATLNPDPDSWVFSLLGPWVDEEHPRFGAKSGEIRWLLREDDEYKWVPEGTPDAKSVTFISANIFDNKILLERDPGYLANLKAQGAEDQLRLLHGKWTAIESKGALWTRAQIDRDRVDLCDLPRMERVVVAVDPAVSSSPDADETGIVVVGKGTDGHFYTLADLSGHYTPEEWAKVATTLFRRYDAACIVAEDNQGGEMVKHTIHTVDRVPVKLVHAKTGKQLRAEPVAAAASMGKDHHVGKFPALEGQMTRWVPGTTPDSPDRLDAKVHGILELDPTLGKQAGTLKPKRGQYV